MSDFAEKARQLTAQMTLAEKAALCSGLDYWYLKGVERLGIKSIMVTDGPHGLRKQADGTDHLGINKSVPATSFPTASATACSFDRDLLRRMGEALGEKCRAESVAVILGPGANIKRNPLCGRNFEYFSEDPYLSGEMAASLIDGVQSQNVGTSLKHFAVNNQETRRMTIDSVVDRRALHEIYLTGFEKAIRQAQPWTVMCSYNKVNGTYASDHPELLTGILRDRWGFKGLVVSDWGATNDRAAGIRAGMDLEMPGPSAGNDQSILAAIQSGELNEAELDRCVSRVVELILRSQTELPAPQRGDREHHGLAAEIARQSAVLLQNDGDLLPLPSGVKIAVLGEMAVKPRYQGAGSSRINPAFIDNALDELLKAGADVKYAAGYSLTDNSAGPTLLDEAARLAGECDIAVVFAGLPDEYESEGFDRTTLTMPESHVRLIEAAAAANPKTVVVLQCGAPVLMPWRDKVPAILLMYLAGQAGGAATADLLLGRANPSGKLAETFPKRYEDCPSAGNFPGGSLTVEYRESIYVGYRYYDTAGVPVEFPFGHGLSYTSFAYDQLTIDPAGDYDYHVTVRVANTGRLAGAESVQLYVGRGQSAIFRPAKELKGFGKLFLAPGESGVVSFTLDRRSFAYFNPTVDDWCVEGGEYAILIGASSADIRLRQTVILPGDGREAQLASAYAGLESYIQPAAPLRIDSQTFTRLLGRPLPPAERQPGEAFTLNSTLGDMQSTWIGRLLLKLARKGFSKQLSGTDPTMTRMIEAMMTEMPLRATKMSGGMVTDRQLYGIVDLANGHFFRGLGQVLRRVDKKAK